MIGHRCRLLAEHRGDGPRVSAGLGQRCPEHMTKTVKAQAGRDPTFLNEAADQAEEASLKAILGEWSPPSPTTMIGLPLGAASRMA